MDDERVREKYIEYQMGSEQLAQIEKQLARIAQGEAEIEAVKGHLDTLSQSADNAESLVPLAEGIFVKSRITNTKTLVMNVGAGVCVEKDVAGAKKLLDERRTEMDAHRQKLSTQMQEISQKVAKLESELQQLVS